LITVPLPPAKGRSIGGDSRRLTVDAIADDDLWSASGLDAPPILQRLRYREGLAAAFGGDMLDVTAVLAHQIGPGRPYCHLELDRGMPVGRHDGFDLDVMRVRRREGQRVAERCQLGPCLLARLLGVSLEWNRHGG
jgi:hypothetical protein